MSNWSQRLNLYDAKASVGSDGPTVSGPFGVFHQIVPGGRKVDGIVIGVHPGSNPPDGWVLELATRSANHQHNVFATLNDNVQFIVVTPRTNPREIDQPIYARTNVYGLETIVSVNNILDLNRE